MTRPGKFDAGVHLFFDFISQPSRALYIILKFSGKPFTEHQLDLLGGEHMTDEYASEVNRFQKVPAICDGDFKLAESIAILRYLSAKQIVPAHLYPTDLQSRARIDEFLQWQHNGVRTSCSLYFRFLWVEPRIVGEAAPSGKVAKYRREMESDFALMERTWLADTKFLTGDALTVADIFGACEVEQIRTTGYKVRDKFPKLANWIEAVRNAMAPHFDEAHRKIYAYEAETLQAKL